jgi:HK97 family phage portal protein
MTTWTVGQPVWTDRRYDRLADEAFLRNAVAYRCIKMISGAASAIPMRLKDKAGVLVEEHDLLNLIAGPAPMVSSQALWEAFFAYLLIAGNTYLEAVGPSENRPPMELWPYRPDRMEVIAGKKLPQGYKLTVNGIERQRWDVDQITGASPILHLKEFHPLNDWYGLSRVDPAAYGIDRHNAASAHNKALLDAGARPTGALIFKPAVVNGSSQSAPPEVIAAAEQRLAERHLGADKAGRPFVFGGDVTWQEMGISPRDMDFAAGKNDAARDICTSFGVPHILIVPGTQSYNNVREARLELYEDTVLPLAGQALSALNAWLTPRYSDKLRLEHDLDSIPALEPRREAKRTAVLALWKGGLLKRDEARAQLQIEPIGGVAGDELCVPSTAGEEPASDAPVQAPPEPDTKQSDK